MKHGVFRVTHDVEAPFCVGAVSQPWLAYVAGPGILWGTGGLAVVQVRRIAALSALTISAYRTGIAAVVVLAVVLALGRAPAVRQVLVQNPVRAVVVGLLTGTYQALLFVSVIVIAVGVTVSTVISVGLAPVILTGAASVRTRTAPGPRAVAVVVAALAGLVLVARSSGTGAAGPDPLLGVLAALVSGSAYAVATGLGALLARSADPLSLAALTMTVGALGLVPLAFASAALGGEAVFTTDPAALVVLLYLGAITMALGYGLPYAGLRITTSATAVVATLLEPVTVAAVAAMFLSESLHPSGAVGALLILLALAGSGRANSDPSVRCVRRHAETVAAPGGGAQRSRRVRRRSCSSSQGARHHQ